MLGPETVIDMMRKALALPSLRMREWSGREPVTKVRERSSALGRVAFHEREFESPIFEWEIDGKRYAGAPELSIRKTEWRHILSSGERHHVDWLASFESLRKMVAESRVEPK